MRNTLPQLACFYSSKFGNSSVSPNRTLAREAVQGDDFDALAVAHNRALAKLSDDIATAIRTKAREKH